MLGLQLWLLMLAMEVEIVSETDACHWRGMHDVMCDHVMSVTDGIGRVSYRDDRSRVVRDDHDVMHVAHVAVDDVVAAAVVDVIHHSVEIHVVVVVASHVVVSVAVVWVVMTWMLTWM